MDFEGLNAQGVCPDPDIERLRRRFVQNAYAFWDKCGVDLASLSIIEAPRSTVASRLGSELTAYRRSYW
jgi:hypothetical protein